MKIGENLYCNRCHLLIGIQRNKTLQVRVKGALQDFHYHNRDADDCWNRTRQILVERFMLSPTASQRPC